MNNFQGIVFLDAVPCFQLVTNRDIRTFCWLGWSFHLLCGSEGFLGVYIGTP